MTAPLFTAIIPTHDHADTLYYSIKSVQNQSLRDLELFVVGDGVPDRTREIMRALCAQDSRIRFFDNLKGERHGEAHRHAALAEARGRFVAYLADDDLWFPAHLATLAPLLENHDFAHTIAIGIAPEPQEPVTWFFDAAYVKDRADLWTAHHGFGLACGAHTLAHYQRLPEPWVPGPKGFPTDLAMWKRLLAPPDTRYVSCYWPTVAHMGKAQRAGWTTEQKLDELEAILERISDPARGQQLIQAAMMNYCRTMYGQLRNAEMRQQVTDASLPLMLEQVAESAGAEVRYTFNDVLTFDENSQGQKYLASGFSHAESWGCWSQAPHAVVVLPLNETAKRPVRLELSYRPFLAPPAHRSLAFTLVVNGRPVAEREEKTGIFGGKAQRTLNIKLDNDVMAGRDCCVIEFRLHNPVRPCDVQFNNDKRLLGLGLVDLCLKTAA